MGYAVGDRRGRTFTALLVAFAGVLALSPAPAHAELPVTDLLVAPAGAQLETRDGGNRTTANGDFLHHHEGLEVTVVDGASGAVRAGGELAVLVTVVRLANERQAAEALAALGDDAPFVEILPAPGDGAVARRTTDGVSVVEFARATGRDVVVFAQLDGSAEPLPVLHAALDAHRTAFPDSTLPATSRARPSWARHAGVGGVVVAAVGLLAALTRRRRRTAWVSRPPTGSASPRGDDAPPARANW